MTKNDKKKNDVASPFRLCLVTDSKRTGEDRLVRVVTQAVKGGVDAVQVREKHLGGARLLEMCLSLGEAVGDKARILVNDRADVAACLAGAGVHLPGSGLSPADAEMVLGKDRLKGLSAHSVEEALAAEKAGADYVILGPIHDTESKRAYGPPLGLGPLEKTAEAARVPVIAIGGMVPGRVADAIRAGASGVAVMSYILGHEDPEKAAAEIFEETLVPS